MQSLVRKFKILTTYGHLCKNGRPNFIFFNFDENIKFTFIAWKIKILQHESEFFTIEKTVQFLSFVSVKCYHYSVQIQKMLRLGRGHIPSPNLCSVVENFTTLIGLEAGALVFW